MNNTHKYQVYKLGNLVAPWQLPPVEGSTQFHSRWSGRNTRTVLAANFNHPARRTVLAANFNHPARRQTWPCVQSLVKRAEAMHNKT